jgi:hypothetical protein
VATASRTSSLARGDVEAGRAELSGNGRARVGAGGAVGKIRAVWSAVGRVAGFLPAEAAGGSGGEGPALGSTVMLQGGGPLPGGQQSSTSWGVSSSGPEGLHAEPHPARRAAAQQGVAYQQNRQTRVSGAPALQPHVALAEATYGE